MARAFSFEVGRFYHIYNCGIEKREIFTNQHDYNRFVALLYLCNNSIQSIDMGRYFRGNKLFSELVNMSRGEHLVDIGSYCLMPNHFHLLLHERREGGISSFMQKLSTAYSMYFNKKFKRSGSLFGGRFKARIVKDEKYLEYLFGYINLNPIKLYDPNWKEEGIKNIEGARDFLNNYKHSSYLDLVGTIRPEEAILDREAFSRYFESPVDFSRFLDDWLSYEGDELAKESRKGTNATVKMVEKIIALPTTAITQKELTVVQ